MNITSHILGHVNALLSSGYRYDSHENNDSYFIVKLCKSDTNRYTFVLLKSQHRLIVYKNNVVKYEKAY